MKQRGRRPRPPRRRTAETIVRTHLAVITGVTNEDQGVSVRHELELVKASLLYADSIEVLSLGNQMVRQLHEFSSSDPSNMWTLLASLDDSTLRHINPDLDPEQLRQAVSILQTMPPDTLRALADLDPQLGELEQFADVLDQTHELANSSMQELQGVTDKMRVDSGVAELEKALAQRFVRFNEKVAIDGDTDAVIESFMKEFRRYLQDPTRFVVLDAAMASMARSMIEEGIVKPPERVVSNASEAALGTGFLARLPTFTAAPLDEVMDLRQDLDDPLDRYRRKVSQLRSQMRSGPFDEHVEADIDGIWRAEVHPAIGEIREAMAEHGLVRELLRSAGTKLSDFVRGVGLPSSLTVVTANILDINAAVTTGLAGAAAAAPTVADAVIKRREGQAAARAHDLYYLYAIDRRIP